MHAPESRSRPAGDLRGFVYEPEPLARRTGWQLEAAQAALGKVQRRLAEAREVLAEQAQRHQAQAQQAGRALQQRLDPAACRLGLLYLAQLQAQMAAVRRGIAGLEAERTGARALCAQLQGKLDGFADDRARAEREYAQEETRRAEVEADRDWIGRASWRAQWHGRPVGGPP